MASGAAWAAANAIAYAVLGCLDAVLHLENRMRVEAYADTKPLPDDELVGLDAATRAARHRRVVVRVY